MAQTNGHDEDDEDLFDVDAAAATPESSPNGHGDEGNGDAADVPEDFADVPDAADAPDDAAEATNDGADAPENGADAPENGADAPDEAPDAPDEAADDDFQEDDFQEEDDDEPVYDSEPADGAEGVDDADAKGVSAAAVSAPGPFRNSADGGGFKAKLAGALQTRVRVRDYSQVSVLSVTLSNAATHSVFGTKAAVQGDSQKAPSFGAKLRQRGERAALKTWSFELSVMTRYEGFDDELKVVGGSLRRTLHDFAWARAALVAAFPGVAVPAITPDAAEGDAAFLERWLRRCLARPRLAAAPVLKAFILSPPSEFAAAQRDFCADGAPTPLRVQCGALFLRTQGLVFGADFVPDDKTDGADDEPSALRDAALQDARAREAARWVADQAAALDATVNACAAAAAADAMTAALATVAAQLVAAHVGGASADTTGAGPAPSAGSAALAAVAADDDFEAPRPADELACVAAAPVDASFGPARALPRLRDLVGQLGAAGDASNGTASVRRQLMAARAALRRAVASRQARTDHMDRADKAQRASDLTAADGAASAAAAAEAATAEAAAEGAEPLPVETPPPPPSASPAALARVASALGKVGLLGHKAAAGAFTTLSLKATTGYNRTAAQLASDDADVDRAAQLVALFEARHADAAATLAADVDELRAAWPRRLRNAALAYAQGEAARADDTAAKAREAELCFRVLDAA